MREQQDERTIGNDAMTASVAPTRGGRLTRVTARGIELLAGEADDAMGWGSYPMVPYAGRVRRGRLVFRGDTYELPVNLPPHAIHGVGYVSSWQVEQASDTVVELSLELPDDERWPFGGVARQRFTISDASLRCELSVTATNRAMPASLGWHPWFRKPDGLDFHPTAMYRRDDDSIALDVLDPVGPPPWDDCFVNTEPIVVTIDGLRVRLTSDCHDWVVYDEPIHATCIEPQTAPPDGLNTRPRVLEPGECLDAWYLWEVLPG